jgi:hypothetical protein
MSAPDPTNDGTFEVLDHLPGQVRQRYVENLGKEELAAIVLAVWRKRDESKEEATGACRVSDLESQQLLT